MVFFARGNLGSRELALVFHGRQRQLVVRSDCHAQGAVDIRRRQLMTFLQRFIKMIECTPRLLGCGRLPPDRKLVSLGADIHAKLLFDTGQIFIELTVKRDGKTVIVEGEHDVGHIRGPGRRAFLRLIGWLGRLQLFRSAQPYLLKAQS